MSLRLITLITIVLLFAIAAPVSAAVEISGTLETDTTWTPDDTIVVVGSVTITPDACLTIEPGTVILIDSGFGLDVQGSLIADGEKDNRIVITSHADTLGGNPRTAMWDHVMYRTNSHGTMRYCTLRYGVDCIYVYDCSLSITGCTIENFSPRGIRVYGSQTAIFRDIVIDSCVMRQTDLGLIGTGHAIWVDRRLNLSISRCDISDCYYGVAIYGNRTYVPHFTVSDCDIRENWLRGLTIQAGT